MAEDYSIQQQPSSVPYTLAGATIGGLGGGIGAHYLTKPKYGSYEDIIKEAKDSTDFSSKIEKAEGEEKTFLQAAKDMAEKEKTAGETWDNEFKAYSETHKDGYVENDAYKSYKELVEKRDAAQKALDTKKAELEKFEVPAKEGTPDIKTKRGIANVKKLIEEEKKSIEEYNKSMTDDLKKIADEVTIATVGKEEINSKIDVLRASKRGKTSAEKDAIDKQIDYLRERRNTLDRNYNDAMKRFEEAVKTTLKEEMSFPKGKAGDKLVEAKVKEIKAYILDTIQERSLNESKVKVDLAKVNESKEKAIADLKTLTKGKKAGVDGKVFEGLDLAGKSTAEIEKQVGKQVEVQNKQLAKIEAFKELFKQAEEKAKASGGKTTVVEEFKLMLGKWETPVTIKKTISSGGEVPAKFIDTLTKEELATFNRLVEGGDEAAIDNAIKARKDKISALNKALSDIKAADAQFVKFGGEGAYFKDGVLYNAADQKVEIKPEEIKIAEDVTAPKSSKLRKLEEQLAKLEEKSGATPARKYTEAEIKEKLAEETKKLEEAKKAAEEAEKGLTKGEAKTEAQLKEEFNKLKGDREAFIKKEVETSKEKFLNDSKKWLERKWGFAEHTNWKIAGVALGCAAVGAGLFKLFAPKNNA